MVRQDDLTTAQFEHNPGGYIIIDGKEVAHTLQCAHCNVHWVSVRGSGKVRGFCLRCYKTTCGKKACNVCIPYELRMEEEEKQWKEQQMQRETRIEKIINQIEHKYGHSLVVGGEL